jgi:hypothetical protein
MTSISKIRRLKRRVTLLQNPLLPVPVVSGSYLEDGKTLLTMAQMNGPLEVEVLWWPDIIADFDITLMWNGVKVGSAVPITDDDVSDPATVFKLTLPADQMTVHGEYQLSYVSALPPVGLNPVLSLPITVIVDRQAPGGDTLPTLLFLPGTGTPITETDLDTNDNLEMLVADYFDMKIGDVVTPWIGEEDGLAGEYLTSGEEVVDEDEVATNRVHLFFPRAMLEKYGDGPVGFSYKLRDLVGNATADKARVTSRDVLINEAPGILPPPLVPAFDDGLITDGDARPDPLSVVIPHYDNAKGGDTITIHWGSENEGPFPLLDEDVIQDPMASFPVRYSTVLNAGDGPIGVSYSMARAPDISRNSPPTTVIVDLTIPGGPDPDPETPENENLAPPVVTSSSGAIDRIPIDDYGQDATITIPWETVDGKPALLKGDQVAVTWGLQNVRTITLPSGPVADLQQIVPARYIEAEGAGEIDVTYSITRSLSQAPHESTSLSPIKTVVVESGLGWPGDGQPLLAPHILDTLTAPDGTRYIDRGAGLDGVTVECPLTDSNIKSGDMIQLVWVGDDDPLGNGNPIPGSEFVNSPIRITLQDEQQGFARYDIPFAVLRKICPGSVKPSFKVTNDLGTTESVPAPFVYIELRDVLHPFCEA